MLVSSDGPPAADDECAIVLIVYNHTSHGRPGRESIVSNLLETYGGLRSRVIDASSSFSSLTEDDVANIKIEATIDTKVVDLTDKEESATLQELGFEIGASGEKKFKIDVSWKDGYTVRLILTSPPTRFCWSRI